MKRSLLHMIAALTIGLMSAGQTAQAIVIYASNVDAITDISSLYTIDTTTHGVTLLGSTGLHKVAGLDFDASGNLYATDGGSNGPSNLYILNASNGSVITNQGLIGPVGGASVIGLGDIAFDSFGTLWGAAFDGSQGLLLTIDPSTGLVLTFVANTGTGNASMVGLDFDPSGALYGSRGNSVGHLEDLDLVNQLTGVETGIGSATNAIADIVFGSDGVLYGGQPGPAGNLYSIDPFTGAKTFLFSTGINLSGLTERVSTPEPTTLLLFGAGLLILGAIRRRKA